jgi:hypothetical protein
MGTMRNARTFFVGKTEGKRLFGIPGCRWNDNIKMEPEDLGLKDV